MTETRFNCTKIFTTVIVVFFDSLLARFSNPLYACLFRCSFCISLSFGCICWVGLFCLCLVTVLLLICSCLLCTSLRGLAL